MSNYPGLLLISFMVVLGLRHGSLRSPPGNPAPDSGDNGKPSPSIDGAQVERLEDLMTKVKLYQDPDLDLDGLADSMDMSPRSLSSLISGHYQHSFYDFVNGYRIEAAKGMLEDGNAAEKPIQQVFQEAGFNSKSTFNTLFKKATGATPSAYRQASLKSTAALGAS